ncbi:hypothetical protein [Oceaniglobus trochenteri]|uniref:hypothetical protein n=1 Tax=Oceaniglobus trochenteri TaxID=2763260 RepID=UPI001CFFAC08|nr:hypothetical protein [Oceaniglobus trochenteri]
MVKTLTPKKKPPPPTAQQIDAALAAVKKMEAPEGLRRMMANARLKGVEKVHDAAFKRLAHVQAEGDPGSVEHGMWSAINAIEEIKRDDAGKTVRLSFLRRDIQKLGMVPAMDKLVSKDSPSERFEELIARHFPELTAEAVVMRHADKFSEGAVARSTERLSDAGIDPTTLAPAA